MLASVNPFLESQVGRPRKIDLPVAALRDESLAKLRQFVQPFLDGERPRLQRSAPCAALVLSDPGYGKSHLLGRLFLDLKGSCTLVYVVPFPAAETPWRELHAAVMRELACSNDPSLTANAPGCPSQLEEALTSIVGFLIARCFEAGSLPYPEDALTAAVRGLNQRAPEVFRDPDWKNWTREQFEDLRARLASCFEENGLLLLQPVDTWCKILLSYAGGDGATRKSASRWIEGRNLSEKDRACLSLHDDEVVSLDATSGEREQLHRSLVFDLCALSAFSRPIILCFDQTEVYASSPQRAQSFGSVIAQIVHFATGVVPIVTANQAVWREALLPAMQPADADKFSPSAITLPGFNQAAARELLSYRMKLVGMGEAGIAKFLEGAWFHELFQGQPEIAPRLVLQTAARIWDSKPTLQSEPPDLEGLFRGTLDRLEASPFSTRFDSAKLHWILAEILGPALGLKFERFSSRRGYIVLREAGESSPAIHIVLTDADNGMTWKAVLRDISDVRATTAAARFVFVRTGELVRLPKDRPGQVWRDMSHLMGDCLRPLVLDRADTLELYAAYELWSEVLQGDHPGVTPEALSRFFEGKFAAWRGRLEGIGSGDVGAPEPSKEVEKPLAKLVRKIIREHRMINLRRLVKLASKEMAREPRDSDVVNAAGTIPEVRVMTSPSTCLFLWVASR